MFNILASEHLWKQSDYNNNHEFTILSKSNFGKGVELQAYQRALQAYGVDLARFECEFEGVKKRVTDFSKELHSQPSGQRFMYKLKDKPG